MSETSAWAKAVPNVLARHNWTIIPVVGFFVIVLTLSLLDITGQRTVILIGIYTLLVSGLNLSWGYAGELAFGQVAMFAAGAYVTGILANAGNRDLISALVASVLVAGALGLISGAPGLRLSQWALAITSFFLIILLPQVVSLFEGQTGGRAGLSGISHPTVLGAELSFDAFLVISFLVVLGWLVAMRNIVNSRTGAAMQALRTSPALAESLGVSVYRLRLRAYVLGSLPAGAAGALYAYLNGYISPDAFTLDLMIAVLAASVIGGSASVWGAPVGAAILVLGPMQSAEFERFSLVVYGLLLVFSGVAFATGLAGMARSARQRMAVRSSGVGWFPSASRDQGDRGDRAGDLSGMLEIHGQRLSVSDVRKSFGGNQALSGATLTAEPGRVTAILGANGAGKTTLLNVISGFIPSDEGAIVLGERELTGNRAHEVARLGVGRTFQTPLVPESMSVVQVVEAGRISHGRIGLLAVVLQLPKYRRARCEDRRIAIQALRFADLAADASASAESLPLGTRRLIEVVRAVAREPHLLLLDEPAAGLDDGGLDELAALIRRSRDAGATVVIVEHNVPFVLGLADDVHVMHLGRVIASGSPEEVRRHPEVIASYLGRQAVASRSDLTMQSFEERA